MRNWVLIVGFTDNSTATFQTLTKDEAETALKDIQISDRPQWIVVPGKVVVFSGNIRYAWVYESA